jgi:hypothetical protein
VIESSPAPIADPSQIPRLMAAADAARQARQKNSRDVDMDMDMDVDDAGGVGNTACAGPIMHAAGGVVTTTDSDAKIPQNLVGKTVLPLDATETPPDVAMVAGFAMEHSRDSKAHAMVHVARIGAQLVEVGIAKSRTGVWPLVPLLHAQNPSLLETL